MRTYSQALAFAERQRVAPTQNWYRMCQAFSRQCVGAAAWGWPRTALGAWKAIPSSHRHTTTPPPGSLVYFDDPHRTGEAGHVVFMASGGYCYSNDILRAGKIDKVPLSLITTKWGLRRLGWIDWTPSGAIDIVKPLPSVSLAKVQTAAKVDPPAPVTSRYYPTGVVLVERTLNRLGHLPLQYVDGHYGTETLAAMKRYQASRGSTQSGIPSLADLRALGLRGGFQVV